MPGHLRPFNLRFLKNFRTCGACRSRIIFDDRREANPETVTVVEAECEYSLRGVQGKTEFARSARCLRSWAFLWAGSTPCVTVQPALCLQTVQPLL
jgi:hypothetical protein